MGVLTLSCLLLTHLIVNIFFGSQDCDIKHKHHFPLEFTSENGWIQSPIGAPCFGWISPWLMQQM